MRARRPVRGRLAAHEQVEAELAGERADALGRAGERLEEAIEVWRLLVAVGVATDEQVDAAVDEIAAAAWALVVQRECTGFRFDNLGWIRRHYDIPDVALRRI